MSMNPNELEAESAELLPGREALGKLKFSFTRTTNVTKHVATVHASNESLAVNQVSPFAVAQSEATQVISIKQ
ncbi:hypothetical protein [Streptomyces sp. NPDC053048]|uniref:hypothetical protein n=1 Tax=Streptomyces sp. NPDC053048 TaxID=3365694 RepID=UPI0037D360D3